MLSAIFGFIRGFVNEIFTILGWFAAVIATLYLTPLLRGIGRSFFDSKIIADMSTAAVIFIVTLAICTLISYFTSQSLRESSLNAVDRSLGFGFGLIRAFILLGLFYIMICYIWEYNKRPAWIMQAKTQPLLEVTGSFVNSILPGDLDIDINKKDYQDSALDDVMKGQKKQKPIPEEKDQTGYTPESRKAIESFFEQ